MLQIVSQKHPTPLFEFCDVTLGLVEREAKARKALRPGDNSNRAAEFANSILKLVRARRAHIETCAACLAAEAFHRRIA